MKKTKLTIEIDSDLLSESYYAYYNEPFKTRADLEQFAENLIIADMESLLPSTDEEEE